MTWGENLMRRYNRNHWWSRAKREWKRNEDNYLIQLFAIIGVGVMCLMFITIGVA